MSQFNPGDVVVILKCYADPSLEGTECVVTSELTQCFSPLYGGYMGYRTNITLSGRKRFSPRPHQIRKKDPPDDGRQITQWAECPWRPTGVVA